MTRPLRVAFDNSIAGRNLTGTGVYAAQLIRYLSAMPGVDLSVFNGSTFKNTATGTIGRGIRRIARLAWSHGYFPLLLRRERFDVVHAPAFITPFACPSPMVVTIHDLTFLLHPTHSNSPWRSYVTHLMPSVLRSAGAIICISESTKRDLLRFYKVTESKIHVVHQGVDHSRFHRNAILDKDWARSIGIEKDYVLHVGVFSERKNIPSLLRAVGGLRDRGRFNNYQLVLVGTEAPGIVGGRSIAQTIRELKLQDLVVLAGHIPEQHLAGLYAGASLLAMPSLYEGFGNPVVEAMASGTPVVASDVSSLPEVAGDAALLVPPGDDQALADSIQSILENPSLGEQLRFKGLARAQHFSWKLTAERTLAVYRTISEV